MIFFIRPDASQVANNAVKEKGRRRGDAKGSQGFEEMFSFPVFPSDGTCHVPAGPRSLGRKHSDFLLLSLKPGASLNSDIESGCVSKRDCRGYRRMLSKGPPVIQSSFLPE